MPRRGFSIREWLVQPSTTAEAGLNGLFRPAATNVCLKSRRPKPTHSKNPSGKAWSERLQRVRA